MPAASFDSAPKRDKIASGAAKFSAAGEIFRPRAGTIPSNRKNQCGPQTALKNPRGAADGRPDFARFV